MSLVQTIKKVLIFILIKSSVQDYEDSMKLSYNIEPISGSHALLGEGPHWDIATQSLYYVDMEAGKLMRFDYKENNVYDCKISEENSVTFIIPIEGQSEKFAVGFGRRVVIIQWNGKSKSCNVESTLFEVQTEPEFKFNRFNEGKCDPRGRLFAGTMRSDDVELKYRLGKLYKYEAGSNVEIMKTNIGISNGLAWNEATNKMYYIDSADLDVKEYDYDFEKGIASNPKVVYKWRRSNAKDSSLPDGMTIDTEGNIYVAVCNGSRIIKLDPRTTKVLLEIEFPFKQTTSVAWGGPNLDILFVTTAAVNNAPAPSGLTFKVSDLGAKGLPMTKMKL